MKKFVLVALIVLPSCAIAAQIEDVLDEIEEALGDLHAGPCIRDCTDVAETCLENSNGPCVDYCEDKYASCDDKREACIDQEKAACVNYTGQYYASCMDDVRDQCDGDCNTLNGDCKQGCAENAQQCLMMDADCVADCVEELEDALKGIDL